MKSSIRSGAVVIALALLAPHMFAQTPARAVTIVGADVADGTGAALRRANVRVAGDRIASVGNAAPENGDTVVDGAGPGRRARASSTSTTTRPRGSPSEPAAASQVAQGITTLVVGPDGGSPWPIGEYLAERRRNPAAVNVATFVGHATVRRQVMGDDFKRAARPDEVAQMAALVDQGMREGAFGLSSGLEYEVGGYGETSELVELSKVAARHGGIYMSHIRDEADKSFEALREAIAIGERARIPVQISHIKLGTVGVWHKAAEAIALDRVGAEARRRRHRRRVPVQRVELDDHGAGPRQAVRLSAERRASARRCRRRGERPDRPPRGASGVRVQDARRGGEGPQDDARSSSSSRSSRTAAPASSAPRWWTTTCGRSTSSRG